MAPTFTTNNSAQTSEIAPAKDETAQRNWLGLLFTWITTVLISGLFWLNSVLPGPWWNNNPSFKLDASSLEIKRGQGLLTEQGLLINGFDQQKLAVVTLKPASIPFPFLATNYPIIRLDLKVATAQNLQIVWSANQQPNQVFRETLLVPPGSSNLTLDLSKYPNWRGQIVNLALVIPGPLPVEIHQLTISSLGLAELFGLLKQDWFGFTPWRASTINFWYGSSEHPQLPWNTALAFSLFLGGALWFFWQWARHPDGHKNTGSSLAMLAIAGWIIGNIPWLSTQIQQVNTTWRTYQSKDLPLPPEETYLQNYLQAITPFLAERNARIFALSDSPFWSGKLAYALLPRQVYGNVQSKPLPPATLVQHFRPGDYLAFFLRENVRYDPSTNKIQLEDGSSVSVETLYFSEGNALFRVQNPT